VSDAPGLRMRDAYSIAKQKHSPACGKKNKKNKNMPELVKKEDYFASPNFPLGIAWRDPQPEFPVHKHQFTELLLITRGSAKHVIDDMEFDVSRGDVFLINPDQKHGFTDLNDLALVNVIFDSDELGLTQWNTASLPGFRAMFTLEPEYRVSHKFQSRLELDGKQLENAIALVKAMTAETVGLNPGFEILTTGLFMQLVTFLSRCFGQSKKPQSMSLVRLAQAINYIDQNFLEEVEVEHLAKIAHMSLRNFQRVFTKTMGKPAKEYIIGKRIDRACELLSSTEMSISDIAYESGFNDSNYFTRLFKKHHGITPKAFRNKDS